MPNRRPTFDLLTKTAAEESERWTLKDRLSFHYFNPRGLYAQKNALDRRIDVLVKAGFLPSGWILAYGGFDNYHEKQMREMYDKKFVRRVEYFVWREGMQRRVAQVAERVEAAEDAFLRGESYADFNEQRLAA